ncbi:hypothetical protein OSTOST_01538 [Ostertagia ostertagi]
MESVMEASKPAEEPFESRSAANDTSPAEGFHENELSEKHGDQSCGDMIFEGDVPEERGDHVVGSNFECGAVDVIWLANNELDSASIDKESDIFYPSVEVGANETATVIDLKGYQANSQNSANPSDSVTLKFSRLESPSSSTDADDQC